MVFKEKNTLIIILRQTIDQAKLIKSRKGLDRIMLFIMSNTYKHRG